MTYRTAVLPADIERIGLDTKTMWVDWIKSHWQMLVPLVLGALSMAWLLPRRGNQRSIPAILIGLAAVGSAGFFLAEPDPDLVQRVLFLVLSGTALVSAGCMITSRDPVYSALWFALVTLSVCGLFLLQSAPFIAAATIIIYAGAIIVTFVFVIMLARQSGGASYDRNSEQPAWGTLASFILLGGLLTALGEWKEQGRAVASEAEPAPVAASLEVPATWNGQELNPNPLSKPTKTDEITMRGLGRSLFGDYLFAVELAGTLLMVAAVGAVALAPRRAQGGI